jgi:hypothetical protein
MVNDVKNKGIDIAEIAGDDDTTGFGKLKGIYPDFQMIKTSDRNHVLLQFSSLSMLIFLKYSF